MRDARLALALPITIVLLSADLRADSSWTIPGIVNASGLNGTHFVSDLTVTNPGATPANVTLSFFPGSSSPKNLALNPGQTVVYVDVAGATFGVSGGAGALSISSDQPLLVRAKTYNTAASGTYGVSLPAVGSDRLFSPGDLGDSLWISQDASASSGYRTNVAVVFPDASGGAAKVTVYDADGNARGSQDFSLGAAGLQQFSVGSFAGAVPVARARIAVSRGHAAGYAVVVDNITGDSSLFSFEDLPGGRQDVLVNGVARANGRNAAFFRTDGRFYNPTNTDATVQVSFHASGNANPSPQSAPFVVPAGRIRDVVDVLDSLLSLPVGSAGALRFQSDWPVAILCRTSNVDPSGARPGTFGSQQKPVPLLSFVTSAEAGAAVTGIRQDAAFRTNVGFAAGADGAQYTLTLANAAGATVATTSASLGAFGWTQPGVQDLFPNVTIPENAVLTVKVTAGSVDVFDSSIDNLSGDPVVTPIAALPVDIPSSATIGPAGGSIRSDDGRLTLRVPAGALASPVKLSFQTATNDAPQAVGSGYQILPLGVVFAKKAELALAYGRGDIAGTNAAALTVAANEGSGWFALGEGSVDPLRHTLTVPVSSTAPSPPASLLSGRSTASRSKTAVTVVWGITSSWQITPKGPLAILTDGTIALQVSYLGPSSSTDLSETFLLPTKPSATKVSWLVNEHAGNTSDGAVVPAGPASGTYIAPACPPSENPVEIQAIIESGTGVAAPFLVTGFVAIRVVPREWKLDWNLDATLECAPGIAEISGINASDHLVWGGSQTTITFQLKDDLTVLDLSHSLQNPSHQLHACPCFGTSAIASVGKDAGLTLPIGGFFDPENGTLSLDLAGVYRYDGGDVTCASQGNPPASIGDLKQAFAYSLPGGAIVFRSGDQGRLVPLVLPAYWSLFVDYYLRSTCP